MPSRVDATRSRANEGLFYGWYIVGVGFLANVASTFSLASTLSVFLKPLTEELAVSRGVFSLLRSGEGLIAAALAPLIGSLMDRHGGRFMMAAGAIVAGLGYFLLSYITSFWQFLLVRWSLVSLGDAFMGYMVINLAIAQWFSRRRGRAIALSSMGVGCAKIGMPLLAATLLVWIGWRQTWAVFGLATVVLLVGPALIFMRRSPEDMGLEPDGGLSPSDLKQSGSLSKRSEQRSPSSSADIPWTRKEAVRTRTFWLLVTIFGVSAMGVTGLNLHVFAYVSDLGHSEFVAATVMSVIASMQTVSPLLWGLLAERIEPRLISMLKFVIQGAGLAVAITANHLFLVYAGFFLYGIGLGGSMVLPDVMWANYFGRLSLGKIRGLGLMLMHGLAALGPPFFGFLFDLTGGYGLSFALFVLALVVSACLSLWLRPPQK